MTAAQIGSEISQIDQFLQSLKMGTYDPLAPALADPTPPPPPAAPAATATTASAATKTVSPPHTTSVGLQLIGQFESSSSSSGSEDSDEDSSSESSEEEEKVSMVTIE